MSQKKKKKKEYKLVISNILLFPKSEPLRTICYTGRGDDLFPTFDVSWIEFSRHESLLKD